MDKLLELEKKLKEVKATLEKAALEILEKASKTHKVVNSFLKQLNEHSDKKYGNGSDAGTHQIVSGEEAGFSDDWQPNDLAIYSDFGDAHDPTHPGSKNPKDFEGHMDNHRSALINHMDKLGYDHHDENDGSGNGLNYGAIHFRNRNEKFGQDKTRDPAVGSMNLMEGSMTGEGNAIPAKWQGSDPRHADDDRKNKPHWNSGQTRAGLPIAQSSQGAFTGYNEKQARGDAAATSGVSAIGYERTETGKPVSLANSGMRVKKSVDENIKGVHKPIDKKGGRSGAGLETAMSRVADTYSDMKTLADSSRRRAKDEHEKVLSEIKAQPAPKLVKGESISIAKNGQWKMDKADDTDC